MTEVERTDWPLIGLLFMGGLMAAAQFAKIALTLEPLGVVYPGRPTAWAVSAISVTGIALGVMAGGLVARIGPRRVIFGALALGAAASLFQAALPPWPVLLASRMVEGAAHLGIVVAAPTLMALSASGRDRPVVMGLWGTFFGIGFALTALAVPPLLRMGGVPAVLLAHGGGVLAVLALSVATMRGSEGEGVAGAMPGPLAEHRVIYGTPRLAGPALVFVWHSMLFIPAVAFLPDVIGAPWTAPLLPLLALAGTFAGGVLARSVEPLRIAVIGFVASVVGCGVLALAPGPLLALVLMPMVGLVPGGCFAAVTRLNADDAGQARGFGAVAQMGNLGTGLGMPLATGAIVMLGPVGGTVGVLAALSVAGAVTALALPLPGGRRLPNAS